MNAKLLAEHDLTLSDYEVLVHLSWAPEGRLRRGQLAARVHLTAGAITQLLHGLERAGLVRSSPDPSDRRAIIAQLSDAGHQRLAAAAATHVADISQTFTAQYSTEELATLAELLGRVGFDRQAAPEDSGGRRSPDRHPPAADGQTERTDSSNA